MNFLRIRLTWREASGSSSVFKRHLKIDTIHVWGKGRDRIGVGIFGNNCGRGTELSLSSGIDIVQVDEVGGHLVADVEVDDPVHEVEAEEGEGEQDAAPLVDVRRSYPHHLVELLRLARQDRRQRNGPGHVLLPQHTAVGTRF